MRILFQGDSITDVGSSANIADKMGYGYPLLVKAEMGFEYPGKYEFFNRGIGGNRIVDIYARMKRDILNLKPDVMSILVGVNDAWHEVIESEQNGVDSEKFYKIYSMLIEEIKSSLPDTKIIMFGPYVLKGTNTEDKWDYFATEVPKRAEMAKRVAEEHGIMYIPLQEKFDEALKIAPSEYWCVDGVHPTAYGHELIKREWIKAFKNLIN
ncbi:MAG: SGNH/GDSL hydrolase family protein [Firmicutes bacterium]|nr:SGNH/GDSL hydrolase family protein [Bacillota bacterium]